MDAQFFFNRGLEKSTNRDLIGAIDDYTKAIELSSRITKRTITTKKSDGSMEHVNIIETNEGNVNVYFNRAFSYFAIGNYLASINDYSKVIEYSPKDAEAYFKRAAANYCFQNDKGADEDLSIAIKLNPKYSRELFLSQFSG